MKCIQLLLLLCSLLIQWNTGNDVEVVSDEASLNIAISDNANIIINSNIALIGNITMDRIEDLVIDGDGYTLSGQDKVSCFFIIDSTVSFHNVSMTRGFGRYGGAMAIYGGSVTLSHCSFFSNWAVRHGAGVYIHTGSLSLNICKFYNNIARANGGSVYVRDANTTIIYSSLTNSKAKYGGGIYAHEGDVLLSSSTMANNTATAYGGAFCSRYAHVYFHHSDVFNNSAKIDGGGVYVDDGSLNVWSTELYSNVAGWHGGGMYLYDCVADISWAFFHNNEMGEGYGGGLYINFAPRVNLTGLLFMNNTAYKGGGLLVDGSIATTRVFSKDCEFYFNSAVYGGGSYVYDGDNHYINSTYRQNYAISPTFKVRQNATCFSTALGGCLYSSNFPKNYDDNEYCEFEALDSGITDVITFQTEADYDWMYIGGEGYSGSLGPDDKSMTTGDIITWISDGGFNKEGFEICFTELGGGGGIYIEGGMLNLIDSLIATNEATQYGGGVFIEGGANYFTDVVIFESKAAMEGVEIYFSGGTFQATNMKVLDYNTNSLAGQSAGAAICQSSCSQGQSGSCESISASGKCYVNCGCDTCPRGRYSSSKGSTTVSDCEECSAGYVSLGTTPCEACAAGKYATFNESNSDGGQTNPIYSGAALCNDCPSGFISTSLASFVCQACQSPSTSTTGSVKCDQAIEEYYAVRGSTMECAEGTICYGGLMVPVPENGYWIDRKNFSYVQFPYKCQRKTCKVASYWLNSTCWTEAGYYDKKCNSDKLMCKEGARGPLCQSCDIGYKYASDTLTCTNCTSNTSSYLLTVIFISLVILFVTLLLCGVIKLPRKVTKSFIMTMLYTLKANGSLTILFSTYQIIESVTLSMELNYPSPFNSTLRLLSWFNLDFAGFECEGVGVMDRVYVISTVPVVISILSAIVGQARILHARVRIKDENNSKVRVNQIFSQHAWFVIFLSYLVLPPVLNKQLKALDCFSFISGKKFLRIDTSVNCDSNAYEQFKTFNVLMICVYVSMPVIWVVLLYRRRDLLFPTNVPNEFIPERRRLNESLSYLSFLYERYRPDMAYWEALDMLRRVLFVGVIPLMAPSTILRAVLGIFFSLLAIFLYREVMPYNTPRINRLAYVANGVIFTVYAGSLTIEDGVSENFDQVTFGLVLTGVNFTTITVALGAAYLKTKRDRALVVKRRESLMKHVEPALSFTEVDFDAVKTSLQEKVPPGHVVVYFYGTLHVIHKILHQGIHVKRAKSIAPLSRKKQPEEGVVRNHEMESCSDKEFEEESDREGVVFTQHLPHQLSALEKSVFGSVEAMAALSLPIRSLRRYQNPSSYSRGSLSDPSQLVWLSSKVLHALRSSFFEGVLDRKPWKLGILFCPPHCIQRAFQLEEIHVVVDIHRSFSKSSESFNMMNKLRNNVVSTDSFNDGVLDDGVELQSLDNLKIPPQPVRDDELVHAEVGKAMSYDTVLNVRKVEDYLSQMSAIRQQCAKLKLVPVYHFTAPQLVPLILRNGFRMTAQGQGGGVYFTSEGPACYGLGSASYEDSLILDMFGEERLGEYQGRHLLDSCIVYAIEPMIIRKIERAASRSNFVIVPRHYFESYSLPRSDGHYLLREDRILGVFNIDTCLCDELDMDMRKRLDEEKSKDLKVQQKLLRAQVLTEEEIKSMSL